MSVENLNGPFASEQWAVHSDTRHAAHGDRCTCRLARGRPDRTVGGRPETERERATTQSRWKVEQPLR